MSSHDGAAGSTKTSSDDHRGSVHHAPSDALTNPHKAQPAGRRVSRVAEPMQVNHAAKRMSVFRRLSVASGSQYSLLLEHAKKPAKLENTYNMAPHPDQKYNASRVEKVISGVLNSYLDGEDYEPRKCTLLAKSLSDVIKSRVKDMDFDRYKIVCNVHIGEKGDQSLQYASRCVWNTDTDGFSSATYKSATLYAVATVYALYFE